MEEKLRIALAEQHRNTRHDAIDVVQEVREKWDKTHSFPELMFNEMVGRIMNLRQRTPDVDEK
jgi:hypothetical protein